MTSHKASSDQETESYVLGSLYSRYSLSTLSNAVLGMLFLGAELSFTSGYISTLQASPPIVSQASAGKTLQFKSGPRLV